MSPLGSRVVSQKVNFLGQGNKGRLISSAVRRRAGEYPPARLLLPGGLAACGSLVLRPPADVRYASQGLLCRRDDCVPVPAQDPDFRLSTLRRALPEPTAGERREAGG